MNLWLDDVRDPEDYGHPGWKWVKTAKECIEFLKKNKVQRISLDHDLGDEAVAGSGYDVAVWMEENSYWPDGGVQVHSMNPVGRARMEAALASAKRRAKM